MTDPLTDPQSAAPLLSHRFHSALVFAAQLHHQQLRKGCKIPYVAHLLMVSALVIEDGGDEDEAIAALLHDAVEDQGGPPTLQRIRGLFGDRVAQIVSDCSDTDVMPKPPWRQRKESYLRHLRTVSPSARRVSLADKLHNARSVLTDHHALGEELWTRFNAGRDDQLWYYRELLRAYKETMSGPLLEAFERTVADLHAACGAGDLYHSE